MALPVAIYFAATDYGYVLDDKIVITDNSFTKQGISGIDDLMTTESMTGYFGEQKNLVQGNRYRPLSLITFAIEYELAGSTLNPKVSHWVNILLYGLTGIALLLFFQTLYPSEEKNKYLTIPFLAALFFIAHPIHVEAVANIKGRDEVMALLLSIISTMILLKSENKRKWLNLALACFVFFLAILAKENSVTFIAVVPVVYWIFKDMSLGKSLTKALPFIGVFILYMILRVSAAGFPAFGEESNDIMNNPFLGMSGIEKLSTIGYTLLWYIKLLFVPYPMSHDYYPYAFPIMNLGDWQTWLSFSIYGMLIYLAAKSFAKKKKDGFPLIYYLITLTIVSNVVVNLGTFLNDRFVYMPSVGFCLLMIILIHRHIPKRIAQGVSVALIIGFSLLSFIRVPAWESALTLNASAVKVSPNSARANSFMATAYFEEYKATSDREMKKELIQKAYPYARKAVQILPNYFNGNLMLAGIAAEQYKMSGDLSELLKEFKKVIIHKPEVPFVTEYCQYLSTKRRDDIKMINFYHDACSALANQGTEKSYKWALHYLKFGIELDPNNKALNQLAGQCYQGLGDQAKANNYFGRAQSTQ